MVDGFWGQSAAGRIDEDEDRWTILKSQANKQFAGLKLAASLRSALSVYPCLKLKSSLNQPQTHPRLVKPHGWSVGNLCSLETELKMKFAINRISSSGHCARGYTNAVPGC